MLVYKIIKKLNKKILILMKTAKHNHYNQIFNNNVEEAKNKLYN